MDDDDNRPTSEYFQPDASPYTLDSLLSFRDARTQITAKQTK